MSIQQLVGTCEGTGAECYISTNAPSGTITAAPSIVPTASPATFAVPSILPTASPAMFPVETSAPATQSPTTAPNADIIPVTTLTPTAIPTAFPTTLPTADAPEVAVTVVSVFEQLTLAGLTDTEVDTFVINVNNALTTGLQLSDLDVIETSVTSSSLQATSAVRLANAADQEKVEGLVQAEGTKLLSENNGFDVTTYGTPDQVYLQGSRDVPPGDDDGEGESSDLVLVAIVVVIGVLAIALVACAAICYRRRRKRNDRDLSRMEMNSVHSANRMGENPSANVGSRADPDSTGNNFHYHEDFHRRDETRHGFQTNGVHEHTSAPPLPGQMQGNGEPVIDIRAATVQPCVSISLIHLLCICICVCECMYMCVCTC
uniref:Uncharacterized protein n=3 Tax=Lotharella globosa TaxID=91324 RepID=A0A7S3YAY3_9EUKA